MIELRKEANAKYKVRVGRSKTGLGLFAMEPIPKGKKIIEYIGKVLEEVKHRPRFIRRNIIRYGKVEESYSKD